jgi:hypothetical protein
MADSVSPQVAVQDPSSPVVDASDGVIELVPVSTGTAVAPNPAVKRRTRNGKIARLPTLYRDMVNAMLRNNTAHARIVGALDEVGIKVTRRNVSNWKTRGGYREWCLAEEQALALRLHQDNMLKLLRRDNASELPELGLQFAAMRLTEFFLSPQAAELLASDPPEYHRRLADLARVNAELLRVQKYRDDCARGVGYKHDPERIRRETETDLERVRDAFSSTHRPDRPAKDASIPHRNFIPKDL